MAVEGSEGILARIAESRAAGRLGALRGLIRSSELALTIIAAGVGVLAGLVVTGMTKVIQAIHVLLFEVDLDGHVSGAFHIDPIDAVLWPTIGGALMGLSLWLVVRLKRPPAVDPIEANALRGGRMSARDSMIVALQTMISNGFGASVGLEAGYTQASAGLASSLGARLKLRRADMRVLVGAGAAAAIAAAFGAPLTGAFYAFEVVIGAYALSNVAPVMAAAIAAMLVSRALGGATYHIEAGTIAEVKSLDYALYLVLGVICAFLAIAMMRGFVLIERAFAASRIPAYVRPAIGGLLVGLLALITPQVLSAGHGALEYDLGTLQPIHVLVMLVGLKMLASGISIGSGFRGGLFFASLLIGALVGQAFARTLSLAGQGWLIGPNSSALVGMGAFAVAIVGGPLTMAFLVLETTGDYALTGAVLATCVVVSLLVREVFGYSFSTWRLHLRGESIRSAHDVGWIRSLTVGKLMRKDPAIAPHDIRLKEFRRRFPLGSRKRVLLVDAAERYAGLVDVADAWAKDLGEADPPAMELARETEAVLTPDLNVRDAMRAFDLTESEALAVVSNMTDRKVIGLLNETHAARRYAEELDKSRRELTGERS
jgi:chloride channel protein, CIC family